jgi:hypothetical protein
MVLMRSRGGESDKNIGSRTLFLFYGRYWNCDIIYNYGKTKNDIILNKIHTP